MRHCTRSLSVAAALLAVAILAAPAHAAERRIALVIGNGAYEGVPGLPNAVGDAALMARTLRGLGFEVIERTDATQREMKKAIKAFGDRLTAAGAEGVGLFYYAGHGVQADGVNYLIPLGAEIADESDLDIEAVSANAVLGKMEYAGSGLNFVILDACRNNPYSGGFRAVTRGLARMLAPRGSLISYATEPGGVAADGAGANSPYTTALAQVMTVPGLPVEQVFKQVRRDVLAATGNAQTTWESSSLTGDFYFTPPEATVATAPPPQPQQPATPAPSQAAEIAFWNTIQDSHDPANFEAYLAEFPNGTFARLAQIRLDALTGSGEGSGQVASLTPGAASTVSNIDPAAAEVALGLDRDARWAIQWVLTRLGYDTRGVDGAFGANTRRAISRFQVDAGLPGTGFVDAATRTALITKGDMLFGILQAERVTWGDINPGADEDALREFLARFPDGRYAWEAGRQLANLGGQTEEVPEHTVRTNRENVIQGFAYEFNQLLANGLDTFGSDECFGYSASFDGDQIYETVNCFYSGSEFFSQEKMCEFSDITEVVIFESEDDEEWTVYLTTGDENTYESCYFNISISGSSYMTNDMFLNVLFETEAVSLRDLITRYIFAKTGEIVVDQDESEAILAGLR